MPPQMPDKRPAGARHDNTLPQWAIDKMTRRRGRRYAHETIDPGKTALVVVDLTQSYVVNTPCADIRLTDDLIDVLCGTRATA